MKRPLFDLAHGRSGDKGDLCNISVIARRAQDYPLLSSEVTAERVKAWFGQWCQGRVERYELPKIAALNFVLYGALDGGALVSLRLDPQGKSYAFALLRMPIDVPDDYSASMR